MSEEDAAKRKTDALYYICVCVPQFSFISLCDVLNASHTHTCARSVSVSVSIAQLIATCIQIQDHNFTVVELDGKPVDPVVMTSLLLNQGQRAALILTADKEDGIYFISARTMSRAYEKFGSVRRRRLTHSSLKIDTTLSVHLVLRSSVLPPMALS